MRHQIPRSKKTLRFWQTPLNKVTIPCGLLLAVIATFLISGCRKSVPKDVERRLVDIALTNSVMAETISAGHYFKELQLQGRLPGMLRDDHGSAESENVQISESEVAKYPISRTFSVVKKDDKSQSKYYYEFYRQSPVFEWRLVKAWRTDSEGKLLEELEVRP